MSSPPPRALSHHTTPKDSPPQPVAYNRPSTSPPPRQYLSTHLNPTEHHSCLVSCQNATTMGKPKAENSKKAAGNARKAEAAAVKQAKVDAVKAAKEDADWAEGSKDNSKKQAAEAKKQEAAAKKAAREADLAAETASLKTTKATPKAGAKGKAPATSSSLDAALASLDASPSTSTSKPTLNASGIDDALDALSLTASSSSTAVDRHPERRFKAAYTAFENRRLLEGRADGTWDGLRLQQVKDRIRKEFEKSDENPFNQTTVAFDASRAEIAAVRAQERDKIEKRLGDRTRHKVPYNLLHVRPTLVDEPIQRIPHVLVRAAGPTRLVVIIVIVVVVVAIVAADAAGLVAECPLVRAVVRVRVVVRHGARVDVRALAAVVFLEDGGVVSGRGFEVPALTLGHGDPAAARGGGVIDAGCAVATRGGHDVAAVGAGVAGALLRGGGEGGDGRGGRFVDTDEVGGFVGAAVRRAAATAQATCHGAADHHCAHAGHHAAAEAAATLLVRIGFVQADDDVCGLAVGAVAAAGEFLKLRPDVVVRHGLLGRPDELEVSYARLADRGERDGQREGNTRAGCVQQQVVKVVKVGKRTVGSVDDGAELTGFRVGRLLLSELAGLKVHLLGEPILGLDDKVDRLLAALGVNVIADAVDTERVGLEVANTRHAQEGVGARPPHKVATGHLDDRHAVLRELHLGLELVGVAVVPVHAVVPDAAIDEVQDERGTNRPRKRDDAPHVGGDEQEAHLRGDEARQTDGDGNGVHGALNESSNSHPSQYCQQLS
ncbi:hypothetical protein Dda_8870 [Drechslerella dactyloides]|uniref:Uncharacterized protein n=1 Tax=Drechslerella dactyloides TaxID=74499 RepID=A0AAD6IQ35_DREDA|nr:hypothetical protein Dda_8870 [Drechslerella dactyloides]